VRGGYRRAIALIVRTAVGRGRFEDISNLKVYF